MFYKLFFLEYFKIWTFEIVSNFGFRASDLDQSITTIFFAEDFFIKD